MRSWNRLSGAGVTGGKPAGAGCGPCEEGCPWGLWASTVRRPGCVLLGPRGCRLSRCQHCVVGAPRPEALLWASSRSLFPAPRWECPGEGSRSPKGACLPVHFLCTSAWPGPLPGACTGSPGGPAMQEETPLAPAQTVRPVILLPQNFLQLVLDRRGRAACCSLSGVLASGGQGMWSAAAAPPCPGPPPPAAH